MIFNRYFFLSISKSSVVDKAGTVKSNTLVVHNDIIIYFIDSYIILL